MRYSIICREAFSSPWAVWMNVGWTRFGCEVGISGFGTRGIWPEGMGLICPLLPTENWERCFVCQLNGRAFPEDGTRGVSVNSTAARRVMQFGFCPGFCVDFTFANCYLVWDTAAILKRCCRGILEIVVPVRMWEAVQDFFTQLDCSNHPINYVSKFVTLHG